MTKLVAVVLVGLSVFASVQAAEASSRLARIKETGILVAAHGETGVPFTYVHEGKPTGFGVDLTYRILDGLRDTLGNPNINIRWNAVTLSTRLPLVAGNAVDIECSATTNTLERQRKVAFSKTILVSDEGIVARKGAGISGYDDLRGRRVVVVGATTTARSLRELNEARNLKIDLVEVRGNRNAMRMLLDGQADAYVASKSILAGQVAGAKNAGDLVIVGSGRFLEAFACVLPKDDPEFKAAVDGILVRMMKDGEMERLYDKWFMKPIPPSGAVINLPLNPATRKIYQEPSDAPIAN